MTSTDYDIIVIGGSANGAQAAYIAAQNNVSVAVIEEHPTTGLPEHCSGLFSYKGLEQLNSMPPDDIVFNYDIYGSRIISPNGKILTVRKHEKHALVCDRAAFDKFLLERATNEGTSLYQPYRAVKAKRKGNIVNVQIKKKESESQSLATSIVISAEGLRASIVEDLSLKGPTKNKFVNAAQFYMYGLNDLDKELVEVYQTQKYSPHYFAWVIPMSDDSAKIGLGTSRKSASKELETMIKNHPVLKQRCNGAEIRRKTAGRIPTSGPVKRTYGDNVLMVGDVAGQTKPTTGGGVILGGIAAQIAGKLASDAIKMKKTDAQYLKQYQKEWKSQMYRNLKRMQLVRNYMNRLSDSEVNHFFNMIEDKGILGNIEKYGHVDDQGVLVRKFMTTVSLYPFYLKTSIKLLRSFFS